jgi:hypothetical protein
MLLLVQDLGRAVMLTKLTNSRFSLSVTSTILSAMTLFTLLVQGCSFSLRLLSGKAVMDAPHNIDEIDESNFSSSSV